MKTHLTASQQNHSAGVKHAQRFVEKTPDVEIPCRCVTGLTRRPLLIGERNPRVSLVIRKPTSRSVAGSRCGASSMKWALILMSGIRTVCASAVSSGIWATDSAKIIAHVLPNW